MRKSCIGRSPHRRHRVVSAQGRGLHVSPVSLWCGFWGLRSRTLKDIEGHWRTLGVEHVTVDDEIDIKRTVAPTGLLEKFCGFQIGRCRWGRNIGHDVTFTSSHWNPSIVLWTLMSTANLDSIWSKCIHCLTRSCWTYFFQKRYAAQLLDMIF